MFLTGAERGGGGGEKRLMAKEKGNSSLLDLPFSQSPFDVCNSSGSLTKVNKGRDHRLLYVEMI